MKRINFLTIITILLTVNCSQQQKTENKMETAQNQNEKKMLSGTIKNYLVQRINEFESIPDSRKIVLNKLSDYIKNNNNEKTNLTFICTHNSRRSHMSQLWAQVAAYYYNINNIYCYSGGTEATAFNERSVRALQKAGFTIEKTNKSENPLYHVTFYEGMEPIHAFSKKYEHEVNPQENFAAIMTCSQADEACPIVFGASERISITYEDPKVADNTPEEEAKYDERCEQIAREMLYVFSQVNS